MRVQQLKLPTAIWSQAGSTLLPSIPSQFRRMRSYADVVGLRQMFRFRALRREFYNNLWRSAARNVGAECVPWKLGYIRLSRGGLTTIVDQSRVMLDDHLTLNIMGDKLLTYDLLQELGCLIPRYLAFSPATINEAEAFRIRTGGAVVVKPAAATGGGRGVTTGITSARGLRRAARLAARHSDSLIVEEHVSGHSYRLLYLEGRLLDAIRRDPPTVIGDGRRSIRQLVREENRRRLTHRPFTAMSPLTIDGDCRNRLGELSLSPGSRLADGESVIVKRMANENNASGNHSVTNRVHPEIVQAGSRIVTALGVRFAGLDLICTDIAAPLSASNTVFSEINTTPAIHHHYLIANMANGVPVAELVLEHLFTTREGVMSLSKALHR